MQNDYLCHYGVKGQRWGVRKKTISSGGRKRRNISDKEKEIIKQHRIRRAKASIKAGTEFMKKNAPAIAAVSTSMNTLAAASKAAKEYDEKIETTSATIVKKQLDGLNNSK